MLSLFMKSPVQSLFVNAFYLSRPYSAISNNPFPSYYIPVTLFPSSIYALFSAMALPQLPWNQQILHSFYRHGGVRLKRSTSSLSATHPKKDKTMNQQGPSSNSVALLPKAD